MKIDVLTLFPEMFGPMKHSIMGQAQEKQIIQFETHNFREFAVNKHGHVDDYPYGGGAGMLLRVEPIVDMLETLKPSKNARIILMDPAGKPFSQTMAEEWSKEEELIFICGHYEGVDNRVREYITEEVSLGDYVLTNGELPTMVMIDATVRLIPDVVGNSESIVNESHQNNLLEHPQYTRPPEFRGLKVPDVLLSGHHENISKWKHQEALRRTFLMRPDLIDKTNLSKEDIEFIKQLLEKNNEEK